MSRFRDIILEEVQKDKDYFEIIYDDYKSCEDFIKTNCQDSKVFESQNGYVNIMMICSKYNNDNITKNIKEKMNN